MQLHEPVPVRARRRELVTSSRANHDLPSGRLVLTDVTRGRNMEGVQPGEIKKLLVLEQLPVPFHNSPGFDGIKPVGTVHDCENSGNGSRGRLMVRPISRPLPCEVCSSSR